MNELGGWEMNRFVNIVIVLVALGSVGGAFYFGTRGKEPRVLDYEKPADPPPPAHSTPKEFKLHPILPGLEVDSAPAYRVDVINVLGHHFLIVYSSGGDVRAAVEFSGNGETHISSTPPAPATPSSGNAEKQSSPKRADGGDGGNFPAPPAETKTEASP